MVANEKEAGKAFPGVECPKCLSTDVDCLEGSGDDVHVAVICVSKGPAKSLALYYTCNQCGYGWAESHI